MKINEFHLIDVIDGLKSIEDISVDIIIADPPYNIHKDFGNNKDNLNIEEYVMWSKLWMDECIRILKPTGSLYIYGFSDWMSIYQIQR